MGFETGAGEFMQLGSYNAAQLRRSVYAWAGRTAANTPGLISGGLLSSTDMQLTAGVSGLVVNTSVGECLIGGTEATSQGGYHGFLSSQNSTTLATANASNPRIDLICATCGDAQYTLPSGGTSGALTIQGVTGTPTAGATLSNLSGAPALPASSLLLGYVLVPAAATGLSNANIANKAASVQSQIVVPGQLIGKQIYSPGTLATYSPASNTSLQALDQTNLTVSFAAPSSGAVTVRLIGTIFLPTNTGANYSWALFSHGTSTQMGYSYLACDMAGMSSVGTLGSCVTGDLEITGLTPGTVYQVDWAHGGNTSAVLRAANGTGVLSNSGPATMKIYAA